MNENANERSAATDRRSVPAAKTVRRKLVGRLLIGVLFAAILGGGIWAGCKLLKTEQANVPSQPAETAAQLRTEASATTAAPDPDSCGGHLTWRFDPQTGLLTIEGSGAMTDYDAPEAAPDEPVPAVPAGYIANDAAAALMVLGYSSKEASDAVRKVYKEGMTLEETVRLSLRQV